MADSITEKQTVDESAYLTPEKRAMTNARYDVLKLYEVLTAKGVEPKILEEVATDEANRAQTEFREKEGQDPIRIFAKALHDAATTDDEKIMATAVEQEMESERSKLAKVVREEKLKARMKEQDLNLEVQLKERFVTNTHAGAPIYKTEDGNISLAIGVLANWVPRPDADSAATNRINLTPEYQTKVLRVLGVLKPDEKVEDLKYLPKRSEINSPDRPYFYENDTYSYARNLQISPGIKANVGLRNPYVTAEISDINIIQKIAEFPNSA